MEFVAALGIVLEVEFALTVKDSAGSHAQKAHVQTIVLEEENVTLFWVS